MTTERLRVLSHLPADRLARVPHEVRDVEEFRVALEARKDGRASPAKDSRRLGEILQEHGLVSGDTLEAALHVQKGQALGHEPLGRILHKMGAVSEENVIRALCQQAGILMVDLHALYIETTTMKKVPIDVARSYRAVPVAIMEGHLFLAVENPLAFAEREYFAFLTNLNVELVFAASNRLTQRLADYGQSRSSVEADQEFRNLAKKALALFETETILGEVTSAHHSEARRRGLRCDAIAPTGDRTSLRKAGVPGVLELLRPHGQDEVVDTGSHCVCCAANRL
jgi:hypothetical protein